MSNLQPSVIPLQDGLDLQSPKLIAKPGSMIDCLNYEIIDLLGYRRIDGFARYDGHVSIKDIPRMRVLTGPAEGTGTIGAGITNEAFEDAQGNVIGYVLSAVPTIAPDATITLVSFVGSKDISGTMATTLWSFTTSSATMQETTLTQTQLIALEAYLRGLTTPLEETPVGLHWYNNLLYAVEPMLMVPYEASTVNQTVDYVLNDSVTSTEGGFAALLGKQVTRAATVSVTETGYLILASPSGDWVASVANTDTLSGAVSVAVGDIYHQPGNLTGMDSTACSLYRAARPSIFTSNTITKPLSVEGWLNVGILPTFTLTITLSAVASEFNTIRKNNTVVESTYYFGDGTGVIEAYVLDYFVVSGGFDTGDAVIRLQVGSLSVESGTTDLDITTAYDMFTDSTALMKVADVTIRMAFNYLPGLPQLTEQSSRYEFRTVNFYASDEMLQMYGVSGAGRAFAFDGSYLTFIYTQDDDDLDMPRHLENHHLHLALGFRRGSVMMSVVGQPTNYSGVTGALEIGIGDRVTGLMEVEGTTLAVFCEQSIWAVVGTTVDNFQTQTIAPNTGCIEYSLANCGFPVYLDNRGVSTLQTSARYGDFVGTRLSSPVTPWLVPRCRSSVIATNNSSGIACAMPIRHKNQYRLFFNDGEILTMTFMAEGEEGSVGFTLQRYYLEQAVITDTLNRLIPICATSEMDSNGVERTYVAHYNADSPVVSDHVYALDSGISFDGKYIPHYFDTNWYYGDAPVQYMGLQKVRLHGLSRGYTTLDIYAAGIQNDYSFGGNVFSTTAEPLNLPRTPGNIYNELLPVTNIANLANRGIGIQLRFKGRNTDLTKPEPGHVAQIMVVYARPGGGPDA